jgi:hypothetical protein
MCKRKRCVKDRTDGRGFKEFHDFHPMPGILTHSHYEFPSGVNLPKPNAYHFELLEGSIFVPVICFKGR